MSAVTTLLAEGISSCDLPREVAQAIGQLRAPGPPVLHAIALLLGKPPTVPVAIRGTPLVTKKLGLLVLLCAHAMALRRSQVTVAGFVCAYSVVSPTKSSGLGATQARLQQQSAVVPLACHHRPTVAGTVQMTATLTRSLHIALLRPVQVAVHGPVGMLHLLQEVAAPQGQPSIYCVPLLKEPVLLPPLLSTALPLHLPGTWLLRCCLSLLGVRCLSCHRRYGENCDCAPGPSSPLRALPALQPAS
mmetsp:Transcript_27688/g.54350  ORF Transcript_27688/g.54350 Transcript_27688/m.54350 type:complete len:246 (-) Transcript_27688:1065-1802(-)